MSDRTVPVVGDLPFEQVARMRHRHGEQAVRGRVMIHDKRVYLVAADRAHRLTSEAFG